MATCHRSIRMSTEQPALISYMHSWDQAVHSWCVISTSVVRVPVKHMFREEMDIGDDPTRSTFLKEYFAYTCGPVGPTDAFRWHQMT